VFLAEAAWIEPEMLPHLREWRGLEANEPCLLWKDVPPLARARNIRAHGHFEGEPGAPDAHAARLALLLLHASDRPAHGIVLLRDDDRQAQRRKGMEQARRSSRMGVPVVIGLAHPKRECWVLAGFEPQDDAEKRRLDVSRAELGFDAREHAERLTAKHKDDKRNAQQVLDQLTDGDREREAACWRQTHLDVLKARGENTGLREYLREVKNSLAPLITTGAGSA
jgi:hypothetical protein